MVKSVNREIHQNQDLNRGGNLLEAKVRRTFRGKAYIESFKGKMRDELRNRAIFTALQEAKILSINGGQNIIIFDPTTPRVTNHRYPETVLVGTST